VPNSQVFGVSFQSGLVDGVPAMNKHPFVTYSKSTIATACMVAANFLLGLAVAFFWTTSTFCSVDYPSDCEVGGAESKSVPTNCSIDSDCFSNSQKNLLTVTEHKCCRKRA
jgi:hypothetical protein